MTNDAPSQTRRAILKGLAIAGSAAGVGIAPALLAQRAPTVSGRETESPASDWRWLVGSWDVSHRRLTERLTGGGTWESFNGKSSLWLTMAGLGTIDDNIIDLPGGSYRAAGIRAFDPESRQWAIWWLDGRYPAQLDPPVMGRFTGNSATFTGDDTLRDRPIKVRFRWSDIHGAHPHWEQAFSADQGASWETNWEMALSRTADTAKPFPAAGASTVPGDWNFLVGRWSAAHRRLKHRLVGSAEWEQFTGTLVNRPLLGGLGNVSDNMMGFPAGPYHGIGLRAFDPKAGQWLSWWLDGRDPLSLTTPLRGKFVDGVGTLTGEDTDDGKPILVRVTWSSITPSSARWEQSASADNGKTWESNWITDFTREA